MHIPPSEIFKAYDIRGEVGRTLTAEGVTAIARAVAAAARAAGHTRMVLGRDGRLSSLEFAAAATAGLRAGGVDVLDIGEVTTPMSYFAAYHLDTGCALMVTGSHNPPGDNGLKIVIRHAALSGAEIRALRQRLLDNDLSEGQGTLEHVDIAAAYQARIVADIHLARPLHLVLDAGNGIAGAYAPALFRALGCSVEPLYCEVDGHFPHHHPDPSVPTNLGDLIARVRATGADLGLAFDGDGDRLGVVTRDGRILYPDRLLMPLAADVLARHPGARVLYDIKSTRLLDAWIREHSGEPEIWRTGHSVMKARMRETGALLGGELSGHVYFAERWYGFDDGLYAGARLLETLAPHADASAVLNALPQAISTPELHVRLGEGGAAALLARLGDPTVRAARFTGATRILDIDGLRVEYPDGFGLVRASNTTPVLVLRFEADTPAALARIQSAFRGIIGALLPPEFSNLPLPF